MFTRGILVIAGLLAVVPHATACGFIEIARDIVTLREEASRAQFVLFVRAENARGEPGNGSTDLVTLKVLQSHPAIEGRRMIRMPRFISGIDLKAPPLFVIFGDIVDGKIDIYRGQPATQALADYLVGFLAIDAKDKVKRMRHAFDFLDHAESAIATDAYNEFITSTDPDIRKAGEKLSAIKLRRWLRDEDTPPARLRLYGYLLGCGGHREDARLLRDLLDQLVKSTNPPQIDGILTGYTLLAPEAGWAYTHNLAQSAGFPLRYAALRTARYFYNTHPGVVSEEKILRLLGVFLGQEDMADLAIEEMRKRECWKLTDPVLGLWGKPGFGAPIIRRAVVRYALQCPDDKARKLVAQVRQTDADFVAGVEELLKEETPPSRKQ
jgi:hypothetical protein